jgi:hypothetical protein
MEENDNSNIETGSNPKVLEENNNFILPEEVTDKKEIETPQINTKLFNKKYPELENITGYESNRVLYSDNFKNDQNVLENQLYAHNFKNDSSVLENVAVECFLECISRFNLAISYSKQPKLISYDNRSKAYVGALNRVIDMASAMESAGESIGNYLSPNMNSRQLAYGVVKSAREGAHGTLKSAREGANRFGNEINRRYNEGIKRHNERLENLKKNWPKKEGGKFTLRRSKKSKKSRKTRRR